MAEQKDDLQDKPVELVFRREYHDIPNYYVNVTTVRTSESDVQLILSQQLEKSDNKLTVVPQAVIYMSHVHAKQFLDLLQRGLKLHAEFLAKQEAASSSH
ncbi:MAG: DUF3467 domain-containing protein [Steroidobacteraceae bacterium]|nr:DUF3467 domain-containing protein [Steroidobacteraceae bacterium]